MASLSKILVAIQHELTLERINEVLHPMPAECHFLAPDEGLDQALRTRGPFQLVLASANVGRESALQSLARARQSGDSTPFLVLGHSQGESMRVFVSDGEGVVLSSRVLTAPNLARLVRDFIGTR
ncbi:MAG: hypothetical protein R3B13_14090 [Polyangiaceae bacterium]